MNCSSASPLDLCLPQARYPRERHAISSFIAQHGITNLVMISGDAHMLGLDNGVSVCGLSK